jgi:hypothetical protein
MTLSSTRFVRCGIRRAAPNGGAQAEPRRGCGSAGAAAGGAAPGGGSAQARARAHAARAIAAGARAGRWRKHGASARAGAGAGAGASESSCGSGCGDWRRKSSQRLARALGGHAGGVEQTREWHTGDTGAGAARDSVRRS